MESFFSEQTGKEAHDDYYARKEKQQRCVWVNGPLIVGAGPSGLATAACLQEKGVPSVILERADCIASLWQHRTYDRLRLHLPKQFCELPLMPFPPDFPTYPDKLQFIAYLELYAQRFHLRPEFNQTVESAFFDRAWGLWRVHTRALEGSEVEYVARWLVVATGENAEPVIPELCGDTKFDGRMLHTCEYRNGEDFQGQNVLVVGCGNSGMEVSLDLSNHNARPSICARNTVHVLPREMLGKSTFGIAMCLLKWLPLWLVDRLLLLVAWIVLGNTERYGLRRPEIGPLKLKNECGKTPVLDVGALAKIRKGQIKVQPALECLTSRGARFVNGEVMQFDSVILATGYRSNVPSWLKGCDFFTEEGMPRTPFPNGWKGENGLYAVGFTRKGLLGASMDAKRIAEDIATFPKADAKQFTFCRRAS